MKKFLMLLVAGTLALSITGCKKDDPVEDVKKDAKEVVEDAKKDVKEVAK